MNGDTELDDPFLSAAVEGLEATGAQGSVPAAGAEEPDPDWQPL
ncbi:hypothetical protein [Dyella sedimenti]|nr:hypothetical protein [Dyella sedimenti]